MMHVGLARATRQNPAHDAVQQLIAAPPILPSQFWTGRRAVLETPEGRLMIRVLEEAVGDYLLGQTARGPKAKAKAADARGWFESPEREWPYSFLNICDVLDLDPDAVRANVFSPDAPPRHHHHPWSGTRHRIGGPSHGNGGRG